MENVQHGEKNIPEHIAIIMDGNGRWAQNKRMPRYVGHKAGVDAVKKVVEGCIDQGVKALTLFAFSSENWRRPEQEVNLLMELFLSSLKKQIKVLHKQNIRLRVIGDKQALPKRLQAQIARGEELTADNQALNLQIAANYGGRWDIAQAAQILAEKVKLGELCSDQVNETTLAQQLAFAELPDPDLFIRTGGECRISNFLLWQLAYAELVFTPVLWPDFDQSELQKALDYFSGRQRRYGFTSEQIEP